MLMSCDLVGVHKTGGDNGDVLALMHNGMLCHFLTLVVLLV